MARVCLPKENRDALLRALKGGDLNLSDLYNMSSSAERRAHFSKFVPEDQLGILSAKFEQAMMSNQKDALKRWVISSVSAKDPIRKDLLKRVERIKKVLNTAEEGNFLEDLVEHKLGISVTKEETENIMRLKRSIDETKANIQRVDANGNITPDTDPTRLAYGLALRHFKNYIGDLKLKSENPTYRDRADIKMMPRNFLDAGLASKAFLASMDLSYSLRQGIKALLAGEFKIWGKSFATSMKTFGKELTSKNPQMFKERDTAVMDALYAKIYGSENALNGKFTASKDGYGIGLMFEEAFPSALPEKIPALGKVFKASQSAYEAAALQMRYDLANKFISYGEQNGLDMLNEANATAFGHLVGSMTGRSGLGVLEPMSRRLNATLFAPRFLASNFQTLTGHTFDKAVRNVPLARKAAAINTIKIAASLGTILATAKALNPDSVEEDPRSTKFGKIKVADDIWIDITGGMSGLAVLGARLVSGQSKSSTGKITEQRDGASFGTPTSFDVIVDFLAGKAAPGFAAIRDFLQGSDFDGNKPTVGSTLANMSLPISFQNLSDDVKKGNDDFLVAAILEGLGLSVSRDTLGGYSNQWKSLAEKRGDAVQNKALKEFTDNFRSKLKRQQSSSRWKRMTQEDRNKAIDKLRRDETARIMSRYGIK